MKTTAPSLSRDKELYQGCYIRRALDNSQGNRATLLQHREGTNVTPSNRLLQI